MPGEAEAGDPRHASNGQRYAISRRDGQPLAIAGLWEAFRRSDGEVIRTYCIITVAATGAIAEIYDRMPLVLNEPDWPLWLGETEGDPVSLLRPAAEDVLRVWRVSRVVNDVRNDGRELLDELALPLAG